MVRLLIALMLAALPVTAHSATIVTYTGSGPGTGSDYDYISGITTPTQGTASFQLTFDLDLLCVGDTLCGIAGNEFTAHSTGSGLPTQDIALTFDHVLAAFPLSNTGFLGGTLAYEYGGPDTLSSFLGTIDTFDVTVADGPQMLFTQFQMFVSARPVPEPASWAMLILGLGAIGATLRRRREPSAIPA